MKGFGCICGLGSIRRVHEMKVLGISQIYRIACEGDNLMSGSIELVDSMRWKD
jgi:hypothetical protein